MKKLSTLFFLATAILTASSCETVVSITQENRTINNFTYNDGTVTWSYIYDCQENAAVANWFKSNFNINREEPTSLFGTTGKTSLPVSEVGLDRTGAVKEATLYRCHEIRLPKFTGCYEGPAFTGKLRATSLCDDLDWQTTYEW